MNLKRLTEILPLFGVFLVLLGYLKLYLYYDHWNIAIIDYLDISEITLLFLSDVHILIAFIAIFLFPITLGAAIIKYFEIKDENRRELSKQNQEQNLQSELNSAYSVIEHIEVKMVLMIVSLLIALIFIACFFAFNKIWLLYFSTFGFIQFVLTFLDYIFHNNPNDKAMMQITFTLSATVFAVLVSHYDICKTERSSESVTTTIISTDTTIVTSPKVLFVGKTTNYLFLYNSSNKEAIAISNNVVKEIRIQKQF